MMKTSEYVAKCLREEGIETIFTVAAESIIPLLRSFITNNIKIINAKLELSAGFMALVYSRLSRRASVLLVTAGPGVIGSASPIAQGIVEGDPIIIMTTTPSWKGKKFTHIHQLYHLTDQLEIFRPITKAQYRIERFEDVPVVLSKAFSEALSGKPGPVYIEFSSDILDRNGIYMGYKHSNIIKPSPSREKITIIANLLAEAKLPVIIAGRGVYLADAQKELLQLAEMLNAPITTSVMAKGLVPLDHPLYAGVAAGKSGNLMAQKLLEEADVILAIGNRFSEIGTGRYSLKFYGKLIHVNISDVDIGKAYEPYIKVISDAKLFLFNLLKELKTRCLKNKRTNIVKKLRQLWKEEIKELEQAYESSTTSDIIEPWDVIKAIREISSKDAIIIGDVGAHRIETFLMPIYEPGTYITTTSYVSMGIGVPGSIAASLAYPNREVIGIVGDGGFLMTGLELTTAVQYNLKPLIVVFNDASYRVLRIYEKVKYKTESEILYKLPRVDFSSLAKSLGARGVLIKDKKELYSLLEDAFSWNKGPVVIDVHVNPEAIPIPFHKLYGAKYIKDLSFK